MPHIHTTNGEHDLTVTAYIARIDGNEPKGLLHMHRKLNVLLPVGGHVELTETPWQSITHEIEEESGYRLSQLNILQPNSRIKKMAKVVQHPYPLSIDTHAVTPTHFHTDLQYGFVAINLPESSVKDGESKDLRWLSIKEINELSNDEIYENTREVYLFLLETALKTWDAVPSEEFSLIFPDEYLSRLRLDQKF